MDRTVIWDDGSIYKRPWGRTGWREIQGPTFEDSANEAPVPSAHNCKPLTAERAADKFIDLEEFGL